MNKQIEEMANIIRCKAEQLPRCPHTTCAICKATELYNTGYRKSTDVVAEVLADVMFAVSKIVSEHIESDNSLLEAEVDIIHALTELKKKHESEKVDNEQTN